MGDNRSFNALVAHLHGHLNKENDMASPRPSRSTDLSDLKKRLDVGNIHHKRTPAKEQTPDARAAITAVADGMTEAIAEFATNPDSKPVYIQETIVIPYTVLGRECVRRIPVTIVIGSHVKQQGHRNSTLGA